MVSPLKAAASDAWSAATHFVAPITNTFGRFLAPAEKAIGRATTLPGMGGVDIPPPPPPSQSPIGQKPKAGAGQTSFLSAATRAGLSASMAGGATGKTLLGQ